MTTEDPHAGMLMGDPSVELASNRTAMSFDRTRMSVDRTLMAVIRTSLSLISFGFTINQVLSKLTAERHPESAARNFGVSLIVIGMGLLICGLISHVQQILNLRRRREGLHAMGLVHSPPQWRVSAIAVTAFLLLLLGLLSILGMMLRVGPFR